jgi:D-glycero-D-manno-heptose 1,7-bisphosphate phosphatase
MKKLIILDRDGVINYDSDDYIKSSAEWIPIPGSLAAIARLTQAGYLIAIASNQSGIARGLYTETTLTQIHQKMLDAIAAAGGRISGVFHCPHQPADQCDCRKPKPGLLQRIARTFDVALTDVPFIGDKQSDIEAAENAGCQPILVRTGYGEQTLAANPHLKILVFADLAEAVNALIAGKIA